MPKVISIANEKGGVGKTTTAFNIGAGLHKKGKRVLLIDLDQQCNLSSYLGFDFQKRYTISEILHTEVAGLPLDYEGLILTSEEGIEYIPASRMLASSAATLANDSDSQTVLQRILGKPFFDRYEYILIDCRPSLDLVVVNSFVASTQLIIPVQAEKFGLDGVPLIMDTYQKVKMKLNPDIELGGLLLTMFDSRMRMCKEVESTLREAFGGKVYKTVIPRLTEATNSSNEQRSVVNQAGSKLGKKYMEVVEEILNETVHTELKA